SHLPGNRRGAPGVGIPERGARRIRRHVEAALERIHHHRRSLGSRRGGIDRRALPAFRTLLLRRRAPLPLRSHSLARRARHAPPPLAGDLDLLPARGGLRPPLPRRFFTAPPPWP